MKEITDVEKKIIKEVYTAYLHRKGEIKEINSQNTEDIKSLADKLECKPKMIRNAFKFLDEVENGEQESIGTVYDIFEKARS